MKMNKKKLELIKNTKMVKSDFAFVVFHFYNPIGAGDWFVTHAREERGEIIFTGMVLMSELTWQEFTLNELKNMRLPFGEKITLNSNFFVRTINSLKFWLNEGASFRS